jgi:rare lipoprotein A (peptidoglycan hydrolase)
LSPKLLRRQAALAAVALAAGAGAVALGGEDGAGSPTASTPAGGDWQTAVAATYPPEAYGRRTQCEVELQPESLGVSHPVLPCGVDLVVEYGGTEARAEVVDRGPFAPGHEFDLTEALADRLGFPGAGEIRWRFAG